MKDETQEIPPEVKLAMSVSPVKREYAAWRVVAYRPDGSYYFVPNNRGNDYALERNAKKAAEWHNCRFKGRTEANGFAVVKRIRITEAEDGAV